MLTKPELPPSGWVARFAPLIRKGGLALDLAAGRGRHTRLLLAAGYRVRAVDRDASRLAELGCEVLEIDLESGAAWPLGGGYDGIVVTDYLFRPILPDIVGALPPGGVLIYETFAVGNERFGRPRNPDFLLKPGELREVCQGLDIAAFEEGEVAEPRPAVIQRIAAIRPRAGGAPARAG